MPSGTQLARVTDRSPLLLPLTVAATTDTNVPSQLYTVVKIRPTLVHYLVDGRVWCVIRSKVPITDIADFSPDQFDGARRHRLLIAVADGNVWVVTLPVHLQPLTGAVLREFVLERSSCESVQWFYQLSGVQSVQHTLARSTSFILMRSVVTPSTLIASTRRSFESKLHSYQSLELTDLEGEQSTCSLCLHSQDPRYTKLLERLFPEVVNDADVAAIVQGDLDGSVRFSLIRHSYTEKNGTKVSVICSGTLFELDQPVQMVIPFASAPCLPGHSPEASTSAYDALLFLGSRGRVQAIQSRRDCSVDTVSVPSKKLGIRHAVQSLAFISGLGAFILCSNGSAFVFRRNDVLVQSQVEDPQAMCNDHAVCVEKMNFQPGILRLGIHGITRDMSILFVSGRMITVDEPSLCENVASVLPSLEQLRNQQEVNEVDSGSRVRHLLHRIAQTSTESSASRAQSSQMDHQLKTLHSALELLQLVKAQGAESVITCELAVSVVETGMFLDRCTIKLVCCLRLVNPNVVASLDEWSLCVHVRTRDCAVTTYSFPLSDVLTRQGQSIILDPDTLAQQNQGCVWVSCAMVFCPTGDPYPENKRCETDCIQFRPIGQENLLSFSVPLLQDRRFLLAQLSRPVDEDTSISEVAIQSAFRQSHEPFVSVGRNSHGGNTSSSELWGGVQWWAALAAHAHKNASFAARWSKIAPPDAPPIELSPPSRFVISIPSFFDAEDEDDEDNDEGFEKPRFERIVSFLRRALEIHGDEVPCLRRSCRTQHGKLWTILRSISGSLILLRFIPSQNDPRSVDLTIQCSDIADLSAVRVLVLETIDDWGNETERDSSVGELVPDMSEMLDPITTLDNLLEELTHKTVSKIADPQSTICSDEVLDALSQLAHLETQTLTIYWKTRSVLNKPSRRNIQ